MEHPQNKWRFLAGNIICKWDIYTIAMLVINQRLSETMIKIRIWVNEIIFHSPELYNYGHKRG
jgi:hypothetical protein